MGIVSGGALTLRCGKTIVVLAPDRGSVSGQWQVVLDHVETWSEALAIWRAMASGTNFKSIRAWPSEKLRDLNPLVRQAMEKAMETEGWILAVDPLEWTITRALAGDPSDG